MNIDFLKIKSNYNNSILRFDSSNDIKRINENSRIVDLHLFK